MCMIVANLLGTYYTQKIYKNYAQNFEFQVTKKNPIYNYFYLFRPRQTGSTHVTGDPGVVRVLATGEKYKKDAYYSCPEVICTETWKEEGIGQENTGPQRSLYYD